MSLSYDPQERAYYDRLFASIDKDNAGVLPGQDALPFLTSSGLSQQILGEIWALADPDNNGFLTRDGWYKAARLIGWAQKGESNLTDAIAAKAGPYPTFAGHGPQPTNPPASGPSPSLPPLTPADRTKFTRIFVGCGPHNGLISGDKARDVFVKSQLGYDKLGQIWNLADTQQRGSLDLTDFIIGMYLIQACMANPSLSLPATLPPGTYEQASGGRPPAATPVTPQRTGSSIVPQHTGPTSPIRSQNTGTPSRAGSMLSHPAAPAPIATSNAAAWDVTPAAKATSDQFFAQLDPQNRGAIEGDVAVPFMLQSQLDENTLATIWDLADIKHEGKLDRDQFAVAMHLINAKLAGQDVPATLPQSLIPPSLRGIAGTQTAPATGPSNAAKDLFDLFDDPPAAATSPTAATQFSAQPNAFAPSTAQQTPRSFSPAPISPAPAAFAHTFAASPPARSPSIQRGQSSDLLGGDDASPSVPDHSAEIGNKQNQFDNVSRSLTDLTKTRTDLETSATNSASQLSELEAKLTQAREKHETESKAVTDLRTRVDEQSTRLKQLQADVISAESDVSALRSEKDELEQALLRDKEEVRGLQKRMKEVDEEKISLTSLLEKLKKESRQQKGMVSIAKKQLSTAEGHRENVRKEVDEESAAAAAAPTSVNAAEHALPTSPSPLSPGVTSRALSPNATGNSQRSNNPFDRLNRNASSSGSPTGLAVVGAGAAAAAGVVAAGAETLYHAAKDTVAGPDTQSEVPAEQSDNAKDVTSSVDHPTETQTSAAEQPASESLLTQPTEHTVSGTAEEVPVQSVSAPAVEEDPFGAPVHPAAATTTAPQVTSAQEGFDDAFGQTAVPASLPDRGVETTQGESDFDKAFASFGGSDAGHEAAFEHTPLAANETAFDTTEEHAATHPQPTAPVPETERGVNDDEASSDEDAGPEDLEGPNVYRTASPVAAAEPSAPIAAAAVPTAASVEVPTRRSAPPPPVRQQPSSQLDPFGSSAGDESSAASTFAPVFIGVPTGAASATSGETTAPPFASSAFAQTSPGASTTAGPPATAAPQPSTLPTQTTSKGASNFDEDDFDFSDLPPAQIEQSNATRTLPQQSNAFDDEFAGFDDEFGPSAVSGSDQSNNSAALTKSYEMVSPVSHTTDEFGAPQHGVAHQAPPPSALSFDDAFGGDFEPSASSAASAAAHAPAGIAAPSLPERKESTAAQNDDIEDVKKLCAMGFPRDLVIAALDANGYDFQKSLNVLLAQ